MEAIAKYPYKAGSSSELSFHAGELIIVRFLIEFIVKKTRLSLKFKR